MKTSSDLRWPSDVDTAERNPLLEDNGLVRTFEAEEGEPLKKPQPQEDAEIDVAEEIEKPLPMPPYLIATKHGDSTSFVFVPPVHMRPAKWPQSVSIGDFPKAEMAFHKAWETYAHLLHDIHEELLAKLQAERGEGPMPTLKEAVAEFAVSERFKKIPSDKAELATRKLADILHWSEANNNPPVASIAPEHVNAYLTSRREQESVGSLIMSHILLEMIFEQCIEMGHMAANPAKQAKADAPPMVLDEKARAAIPVPIHIFAYKPAHTTPVLAPR